VLQNEKYIAFADDNSVEVLAFGELDKGMANPKDRRNEQYDAKDENGNPVRYLKEFAGCTVEQLNALNSSPANQYNKTGKIPYISIVDPQTLKEMKSMPGGSAVKGLMEAVTEAKAQLVKDHGPSMKRSTLKKFKAGVKSIEDTLTKGAPAKALADLKQLKDSIAKEPESLKTEAGKLEEKVLDAVKADLDKAEGLITSGDMKGATGILKGYGGLFEKGSENETRLKALLEKTKAAPEPAK
jgi:hypothetical protein